jgi:4-deoxy-L-threo-5-hexosulose-uronate ketol-isomerase
MNHAFISEPTRNAGRRTAKDPHFIPVEPQPSSCTSAVSRLNTAELRSEFLVEGLFKAGEAHFRLWDIDRTVLGAVCPAATPLALPNPPELRSSSFLERREAGIVNVGGPGAVTVGKTAHVMQSLDALYLGRGAQDVAFASASPSDPASFWILSYPAHASHPSRHVRFSEAKAEALGGSKTANKRMLYKLIHPGAFPTCQVVMGVTRLAVGSVWNTMPPHTHLRRSEVYLYFGLHADQAVFHFMGEPTETRHVVVRNLEAVLSPPWSVHCGAGTSNYSFVWGMGGENQEFADMDKAGVVALR